VEGERRWAQGSSKYEIQASNRAGRDVVQDNRRSRGFGDRAKMSIFFHAAFAISENVCL
jgi:hypothetical protein